MVAELRVHELWLNVTTYFHDSLGLSVILKRKTST